MIGNGYWSTGITCRWRKNAGERDGQPLGPGWGVSLEFRDGGFCDDDPASGQISTEGAIGTIGSRYLVAERESGWQALRVALDALIADADRMGIEFRTDVARPSLFVPGDGEDPDEPLPEGWLDTLAREAGRLGWDTYGRTAPALPA